MANSDPFSICTNNYTFAAKRITNEYFQKLFTNFDKKNTSATCADKLLNKNKMNVISTFVKYSEDLWETANCDSCYEDSTSIHQNFSNNTKEFLELHHLFRECVSNVTSHNNSIVCLHCDNDYQSLNNIYEHIKKTGKVCFDLEDKVSEEVEVWWEIR
jgi:hypothetical protein